MEIGNKVNYFGQEAEVILIDKTHCVIMLKYGAKICVLKSTFNKDYK